MTDHLLNLAGQGSCWSAKAAEPSLSRSPRELTAT